MAKKELTYQAAIDELEDILHQMESNELQVDKIAAKVKRASELIAFCKTKLKKTETEVDKIINDLD